MAEQAEQYFLPEETVIIFAIYAVTSFRIKLVAQVNLQNALTKKGKALLPSLPND
jgi:hypothetical protein